MAIFPFPYLSQWNDLAKAYVSYILTARTNASKVKLVDCYQTNKSNRQGVSIRQAYTKVWR